MGAEFRAKGVNVALGPVVGPLGKIAKGGRNWEGFSNDPYLAGGLAAETVKGVQEAGVVSCVKHFIGNEQETNRIPGYNNQSQRVEAVSSNINDKLLHEMYLWPFVDAIHAGAGSVMCSYNRVNNSYSCQNSKLLNGILKTELGFQGFVVSDWGALHAGYVAAQAGLDMVMPGPANFWAGNLTASIANGSLAQEVLDNMATRIMATYYQFSQDESSFPSPGIDIPKSLAAPHTFVNAVSPDSKQILLDSAIESHVLVKNLRAGNNSLGLPLKTPELVSVFGYDAAEPPMNPYIPNPGHGAQFLNSTLTVGGGSGSNNPSYVSSPLSALNQRAYEDGFQLLWDTTNLNATAAVNPASSACLVFLNAWATESHDRPGLYDEFSDSLVLNAARQCSNTVVVIHNAGIRIVDRWVEHENVTAVIFAHLPGQDSGRALVKLLWGEENPSGRLPYSVARNEGVYLEPVQPEGEFVLFPQDDYKEGWEVDYRGFDERGVVPRFEFGFGLSYTSFAYSNLSISQVEEAVLGEWPTGGVKEGGQEDLWDVLFRIEASVANTGSVDGKEVAQLYVGIPGGPVKQLRGFEKVSVEVGESVTVGFDVTRRDLSVWDVVEQKWRLQRGEYEVFVGRSSRDLPLVGNLTV
ncbi:glycoside hydrolase family 3 protein [Mollisia scopiformis]|uniref:beta-glucosidase n=1 Tax=Mollisia scopiformis TaxID=149040 RepID=A0A132B6C8_MOLSC|nr:glycoside hydrolase family 3 protein [Mollisia scopiformis]KUJ07559.1 glycoside hydrolase family 3 protein [Mollisia scopiformis]